MFLMHVLAYIRVYMYTYMHKHAHRHDCVRFYAWLETCGNACMLEKAQMNLMCWAAHEHTRSRKMRSVYPRTFTQKTAIHMREWWDERMMGWKNDRMKACQFPRFMSWTLREWFTNRRIGKRTEAKFEYPVHKPKAIMKGVAMFDSCFTSCSIFRHVCTYVSIQTFMYVCTYVCMYVCICICMYIQTHTYACKMHSAKRQTCS